MISMLSCPLELIDDVLHGLRAIWASALLCQCLHQLTSRVVVAWAVDHAVEGRIWFSESRALRVLAPVHLPLHAVDVALVHAAVETDSVQEDLVSPASLGPVCQRSALAQIGVHCVQGFTSWFAP